MYLVIAACLLLFNFGVIVSAHMKQLSARGHLEKLPGIIDATEPPPAIQPSTPQPQGRSEKETDLGRTVLQYVKLSVLM